MAMALGDNSDEDIDNDGINNEFELTLSFDPYNADSVPNDFDGDGIPDELDTDLDGDTIGNDIDLFPRDRPSGLIWMVTASVIIATETATVMASITFMRNRQGRILQMPAPYLVMLMATESPTLLTRTEMVTAT